MSNASGTRSGNTEAVDSATRTPPALVPRLTVAPFPQLAGLGHPRLASLCARAGAMSDLPATVRAMGNSSAVSEYRCADCGWRTRKWTGRCGGCQAWGTVQQAAIPALARTRLTAARDGGLLPASRALPITEVDARAATARPTGLDELDRVLGGGLVPGAVVLLAGEPGVG